MGYDADDSVVNQFGQVHGVPNLFVVGGSMFIGCSGAINPTLTMVAMSIRTVDFVLDQILG
jgi:choline dehydrogenase-like flavoprotein